ADIAGAFGVGSDVLCVCQGVVFEPETLGGGKYTIDEYRPESSKGAMVIQVFPAGDGYRISAEFKKELYSEELMLAILELVEQTVTEFTEKETTADVDLVSPHQKEVLDGFNRSEMEYDTGKTAVDMFRESAEKYPERTAVVYCGRTYTYRELDRITDNIAAYLVKKGIGSGDVVSILIGRSEYMPIASLGVLKSGAAYQPLDSSYPQERLNFMVGDASAKLLIADAALTEKLSEWNGETLFTEDIPSLPDIAADEKAKLSEAAPKPEDLFILLYTSGSTGVPKGVMLEHRNIAAFCRQHVARMEIDENSVVAAYASYGFDANMMDTYPTLSVGAELVIVHEEIRLDLPAILEYYKELRVTHAFMTTQVGRQFAMLCDSPYVKFIYVGGETLVPVTLTNGVRFINIYGPTETTVYVTAHELNGTYKRVPIGRTVENVRLYVADKNMRRLPVGVPGELCVAGHQVSRGYLNRPEKTNEVYVDNPFETAEGYGHVYRTGDVVRLLPDGSVDFVGRNDGQVKVRGFRIELSEVEEIVRRFEGIKDATVAAFDAPAGGKEIAAYIVSDETVDIKKLKDFIRAEKPSYMVPAVIMQIERIPLNQNQKVNKKALPKPELGAADSDENEVKAGVLTEFEEQLLAILKDTTGIGTTDVTTELVALGVTSISAISFVTVVEKKFGVNVPVSKLLHGASIMDIENMVVRSLLSGTGTKKAEAPAKERETLDEYPLTQSQLGVYYESMQRPDTTLYNVPFCLKFDGIDSGRLSDAIVEAVKAHSFLNTHIKTGKTGFM
ncbi:MAG: amino acid adenylation domain-containing protein, partial [Clostridia bacterium]|nr:amino acid adenylation domain-containing protein [Clostridia bacterium]